MVAGGQQLDMVSGKHRHMDLEVTCSAPAEQRPGSSMRTSLGKSEPYFDDVNDLCGTAISSDGRTDISVLLPTMLKLVRHQFVASSAGKKAGGKSAAHP